MIPYRTVLPTLVLVAGLSAQTTPAQSPAATDAGPAGEGLQRSLERVAIALEALLEYQETDLLLKRIEMRERRVAPLEEELRRRQNDLAAGQADLERMETVSREWHDRMRDDAKNDAQAEKELERMEAEFEMAFRTQTAQHEALKERVRRLEDELAERRKWIQDLEALLLERIGE